MCTSPSTHVTLDQEQRSLPETFQFERVPWGSEFILTRNFNNANPKLKNQNPKQILKRRRRWIIKKLTIDLGIDRKRERSFKANDQEEDARVVVVVVVIVESTIQVVGS